MIYFEIRGLSYSKLNHLIPQEGFWFYRELNNGNLLIYSDNYEAYESDIISVKKK